MSKPCNLLTLLGWCFLLLAAPGFAQQTGEAPLGLYNPGTVTTISGIVVAAPAPSAQAGLPEPVHLTLKTDQGNLPVILGPRHFVDRQEVKITALDRVEVTGSMVRFQGKPAIIAAEIKKGDQVLKLREPGGIPLWGGQRTR